MSLEILDTGRDNTIEAAADSITGQCRLAIDGNGNSVRFAPGSDCLSESKVEIAGDDNTVVLDKGVILRGRSEIAIYGNGNRVALGEEANGQIGVTIHTSDATVEIGPASTFVDVRITMHEPGLVRLGEDCMLSAGVWIANSDMHALVDLNSGERLNPPRDVIIGDHVWLGYDCKILKGSSIGSGAVVATGAVVTKDVAENCLVAGVPAKLKRRNVAWSREFRSASREV